MKPKIFESEFNKACELRDRGRSAEALKILFRLEQTGMHRAAVVGMIAGILFYEERDVQKAMPYLRESVDLSPRSARASLALFHALFSIRAYGNAFDEMQRFVSTSQSNAYDELVGELRAEMAEKLGASTLSSKQRSDFEYITKRLDEIWPGTTG